MRNWRIKTGKSEFFTMRADDATHFYRTDRIESVAVFSDGDIRVVLGGNTPEMIFKSSGEHYDFNRESLTRALAERGVVL